MTQCDSVLVDVLWLLCGVQLKEKKGGYSDSSVKRVAWKKVATVQGARSNSGWPYALRVEIINLSVGQTNAMNLKYKDSLCKEARGKYTGFIFNSFYTSSLSKFQYGFFYLNQRSRYECYIMINVWAVLICVDFHSLQVILNCFESWKQT